MKLFRVEGTFIDHKGDRLGLAKLMEHTDRLELAMDCIDNIKGIKHLTVTEVETGKKRGKK